jgi:hypothetical protein
MDKTPSAPPDNDQVAAQLDRIADLLEAQDDNPFRVGAYRQAAGTLRELAEPAHQLLAREGVEGLRRLPHIGERLSRAIAQYIEGGGIALLEHLQGPAASQALLASVPGIGPKLAARIYEDLGIETLEDLEAAAYDGRLAQVEGFGRKRVRAVRDTLATRLRRRAGQGGRQAPAGQPPVAVLLDLDREYREQAQEDRLPRIAPRRFNPTGDAWLPVLHATRSDQPYTVLFSNTPRAHELGATRDWVVIYRDDRAGGGQWTVVTARTGRLQDKRVVRGRERECETYYAGAANEAISIRK